MGFKVAVNIGQRYFDLVTANRDVIAPNVTTNLYEPHIEPIFIG